MLSFIFLALLGLYAFFKVNRAKPLPWMIANVAFLAGMGALSYFMQNLYFVLGLVAAVASVGIAMFVQKLSLMKNFGSYIKMFVSNLLFYPVEVFEEVYGWLSPKL